MALGQLTDGDKTDRYPGTSKVLPSLPSSETPTTTNMKFTIFSLALSGLTLATPFAEESLDKRADECIFSGDGPVGIPDAIYASSNGNSYSPEI